MFGTTGRVAGSLDQVVIASVGVGVGDVGAVATLRSQWSASVESDAAFAQRINDWLASERERRTTWLARIDDVPVGMASMLEYRRMPPPVGLTRAGAISATCSCAPSAAVGGSAQHC